MDMSCYSCSTSRSSIWVKSSRIKPCLKSIHNLSSKIDINLTRKRRKNINSTLQIPLLDPHKLTTITTKKCPNSKNLNPLQKTVGIALNAMERVLNTLESTRALPKQFDPNIQITGNFAPVPEQPVTHNLHVVGEIPKHITGAYVRNGANPYHKPVSGHHLFDGDGMIHIVHFHQNGSVSYACRFTETNRLVQERRFGRAVFPKVIGELHGHSGLGRLALFYTRAVFGLLDRDKGIGVANAGVVFFNGKLLAMSEDDIPYHVRVSSSGDLETKGSFDFDGQLKSSMIAHPKFDPETRELFALSYDVVRKPYLKYFWFDADGNKSWDVCINLDTPTMIHDFAITENYVVVPDSQVVFKLEEMIMGGSPVVYDDMKTSRFGILRKYAKNSDDMEWIDVPHCFCFHLWNAWEEPENDEIVVIGSCVSPADSIFNDCHEIFTSILSEIRLNRKTGKSIRKEILSSLNQVNLEAGMVNRNKLGRKTRFAYLAIAEPWPKVSGFAKVDLWTGTIKKFMYGDEKYGGEPFFLPEDGKNIVEDEGHILTFVHDEVNWTSELQIVNAVTMELVAIVKLPSRVPYGFHGTFISAQGLLTQV